MNTIEELAAESAAAGLDFLLIGGHAIWAYGYERYTDDIDFLVPEGQVASWIKYLLDRGYKIYELNDRFVQLVAPAGKEPIDLMIADRSTWQKMHHERVPQPRVGVGVSSPSPLHLIAMKLHALRDAPRHRSKDWLDVEELIRLCKIDVQSTEFRQIVERYAGADTYRKLTQDHPDR